MKNIEDIKAEVKYKKTGFEIHYLLDRCACLVRFEKRTNFCVNFHNSLYGGKAHPDADVFKVGFNCDDAVFNKGSRIYMLPQGLNTAWGSTLNLAAGMALRMLDYQNIYTQCSCRWTQWDLDFEIVSDEVLGGVPSSPMQRCRLCLQVRDIQ